MQKRLITLIAGLVLTLSVLAAGAAAETTDVGSDTHLLFINETLYPDSGGSDTPAAPYYEWLNLAYG